MTSMLAGHDSSVVGNKVETITRQEAARQACEAAGIVWPGTILPPGTALYQSGVEKLRADRQRIHSLPLASKAALLVKDALASEDRQDVTDQLVGRLRLIDLRMIDDIPTRSHELGRITRGNGGLGYSDLPLRQLVAQIPAFDNAPRGFANALTYLTDIERAEIMNPRLALMEHDDTKVMLRTKLAHNGGRIVRAALTEKYGSLTDVDVAGAIAEVMADDDYARLNYYPGDSDSRTEVVWLSEIPVETFVVGDVHYVCLQVTNSETGQGSCLITVGIVRARCANLTTSVGMGTEIRLRHVGDTTVLKHKLRAAIRAATNGLDDLINVIRHSATAVLPSTFDPAKLLQKIASRAGLPQRQGQDWLATYNKSYTPTALGAPGPTSVWNVVSAMTEAAQQSSWADADKVERAASLFQNTVGMAVKGGAGVESAINKGLDALGTGEVSLF